jgi:hypothetical protein
VLAAGCGAGDIAANESAPSGSSSGSGIDASTPSDGGPDARGSPEADAGGDASVDAGALDAANPDGGTPPTSVIFVHASPSLPSLRLCWGLPGALPASPPYPSDNEMPASNYSGIPVGGAVWLDPGQVGSLANVTMYALRAWPLANTTLACDELICPPGGQNCRIPNLDYWQLGTIAPGALRLGATNLVAISGCRGGDDLAANAQRCGASWDAAHGNLHLEIVPAETAALGGDGGGLWVQAAQLSPGLEALQGSAGVTSVSFGADMSAAQPIAQLAHEGELLPALPAAVSLPPGAATFGQLGFAVDVQGVDAGDAAHLWMSLVKAQELVNPGQDPNLYFGAGGTYVVTILGDPSVAHADGDGGYDGTGLHVLVLPAALR